MGFLRQKMLWIGALVVLLVLAVFGVAMMGSIVGAKPKSLPVALVVLDQPAELPNGEPLAVGDMIKGMLQGNSQMPIQWEIVISEAEAREGLDSQKYYGALVLPENLSAGILSLQSPAPKPAVVQVLVNEGMSTQASTAVKQMLGQAMKMAGAELSKQALTMIGTQTDMLPVTTAQALLTPFEVHEEVVHPVGANHASGNAPGMLVQILWIGCLILSVFLFQALQKAVAEGSGRGIAILLQGAAGLLLAGLTSGFLVWMASSWYGMELANGGSVWLMLWLAGSAFFLLQSTLLNWIGLPAMGILVLLMFFSMPLLNMAPEFLPQATQDWLYSWTPLRFAASALRDVMYFDGYAPSSSHSAVMWFIAGGFLVLLLASTFKKGRHSDKRKSIAAS
ncbi:YhgE/Pip domain-containing protein [Paenibacillus lautus]|uniref:YhgE/Pip domain-containing protein n=1 Tax=Paenibacillus lautus TaxID=1401 RepID=UPI003D9A22AF